MPKTMPALINYASAPHSVEMREAPVPSIGDDDVLLRVAAVGVCGSDLHQYHGSHSWKVRRRFRPEIGWSARQPP